MPIQNLSDEQRAFVEAIRDFARRECGTREQRDALTHGGEEPHNPEVYAQIASLGWLGAAVPEAYGGSGGGAVDLSLLCEEFARGMIPMGFFPITMMAARPVQRFATDEPKRELGNSRLRPFPSANSFERRFRAWQTVYWSLMQMAASRS